MMSINPEQPAMTKLEWAIWYASINIPVFPCQPDTKLPMRGLPWKVAATTDPEIIKAYWTHWPDANIGMPCGIVSGINVIDIDLKDGADGKQSYKAITQEEYQGPWQQTPSGGVHLLFEYRGGYINFTHKGDFGGIDMRTDGGYILLAPSSTPDGKYTWCQHGQPQPMPSALQAFCEQNSRGTNVQTAEMPESAAVVPKLHDLKLPAKYLNYLEAGDASAWSNDESAAVFATAGALMRQIQDAGVVFTLMKENPYVYACAERHRTFGNVDEWLWKYGVSKMIAQADRGSAEQAFSDIVTPPPPAPQTQEAPLVAAAETLSADREQRLDTAGFLPAGEFMLYYNSPPDWLIPGWLERGHIGHIHGDPGTYKTYTALLQAYCVATGRPWNQIQLTHGPQHVLILAAEEASGVARRMEALRLYFGDGPEVWDMIYIRPNSLNLMDAEERSKLEWFISHMWHAGTPIAALYVDTQAKNTSINENDAADTSRLFRVCEQLARPWRMAIVFLHHNAKRGGLRGSTALEGDFDFRWETEIVNEEPRIIKLANSRVKSSKGGGEFLFKPLEWMIFTNDGTPIEEVVMVHSEKPARPDTIPRNGSGRSVRLPKGETYCVLRILAALVDVAYESGDPLQVKAGVHKETLWQAYVDDYFSRVTERPDRPNFNRSIRTLINNGWAAVVDDHHVTLSGQGREATHSE